MRPDTPRQRLGGDQKEDLPVNADLPDVATILGAVLQRVPPVHRPLLIALAERGAAERYRAWAKDATDETRTACLAACAEREEEIARRVESLYPDAAYVQRDLLAQHPDLGEITRTVFAGRPLAAQLAIQARGERAGAAVWRSFARHASHEAARAELLHCAELEEESAVYLEAVLQGQP